MPDSQPAADTGRDTPIRVVLAKLGLDGHDRGLKVVARMLRDAGMEVVYLGLRQTTDTVIAAVEQEDADIIGLSMHNAGHLALAPRILQALTDAGLDVPVVIGGIVPEIDVQTLKEMGISAVLHPGASAAQVAAAVRGSLADRLLSACPVGHDQANSRAEDQADHQANSRAEDQADHQANSRAEDQADE